MSEPVAQLQEIILLLATNPVAAAERIEALAAILLEQAAAIRAEASVGGGFRDGGGMGDQCKMSVIGPDGQEKQRVDTTRN